ncbi:MAG: hypothetical protein JSW62_01945 [Thermoplasmatales archaeon]|nr:MAG: hypothetical protein JSW62_01945 [Thermoplasmatales archaeon]
MMNKKILIGSIFAVILMLSTGFINVATAKASEQINVTRINKSEIKPLPLPDYPPWVNLTWLISFIFWALSWITKNPLYMLLTAIFSGITLFPFFPVLKDILKDFFDDDGGGGYQYASTLSSGCNLFDN